MNDSSFGPLFTDNDDLAMVEQYMYEKLTELGDWVTRQAREGELAVLIGGKDEIKKDMVFGLGAVFFLMHSCLLCIAKNTNDLAKRCFDLSNTAIKPPEISEDKKLLYDALCRFEKDALAVYQALREK